MERRVLVFLAGTLGLLAAATLHGQNASVPPRVILVGWDGADWKLLDPLVKGGRLPNLARLIRAGRSWRLASYQPMASPLIWTTMATGRTPVAHGVDDFQELDPGTGARLPISGRSRSVPAIWNLASARGIPVGVVGWWATWPAEKVKGFLVSDRAAPVLFDPEVLARSPALTWPEGLADGVRLVVRREGSPDYEKVAKALAVSRAEFDEAVKAGLGLADPISGYRKILGVTEVYGRIAVDLYERERPRLLMVYFQGTDEIGHVLGRFSPPKLPGVSEGDFEKFRGGVAALYQEADRILGELMAKAERDGATLLLVSDHGFKWGDDRPKELSGVQFDTAFLWHDNPGVLAAFGPAVVPSAQRGDASVFDITPTLCRLLGLPADPVFEGKVVAGFGGRGLPGAVPAVSWAKAAPVERLSVSSTSSEERKTAEEFTKKLISLGYLTGSEAAAVDARPRDRAGTQTAGSFQNVGTFLRFHGRVTESISWYRKALEVNPGSAAAWLNLSQALRQIGRVEESDEALLMCMKSGYHDPRGAVSRRIAAAHQQGGKDLDAKGRLVAFLRKVVAAFPADSSYQSALGKALFENRDCDGAQAVFRDVAERMPRDFENLNSLGLSSWCLGKLEDARAAFERSLSINPDQPVVRDGLRQLRAGVTAR